MSARENESAEAEGGRGGDVEARTEVFMSESFARRETQMCAHDKLTTETGIERLRKDNHRDRKEKKRPEKWKDARDA